MSTFVPNSLQNLAESRERRGRISGSSRSDDTDGVADGVGFKALMRTRENRLEGRIKVEELVDSRESICGLDDRDPENIDGFVRSLSSCCCYITSNLIYHRAIHGMQGL